jgi:tetratricopeptide (TPR) repeat protein
VSRDLSTSVASAVAGGNASQLFNHALDCLRDSREEEALPLVAEGLEAYPRDARLWQVKGLLHRALDQLDLAIAALDRAGELAPNDAKIAHARARAHMEAGSPRIDLFDRAAALAPADSSVVQGRAAALLMLGRAPEGLRQLRDQLRRQPMWLEGHAALSRFRWMMGDADGLVSSIQEALLRTPAEAALWRELISTLGTANRHTDVLKAVESARRFIGDQAMLTAHAAFARDELGEREAARTLFERLMPISENWIAIRYVAHLLRSGEYARAGDVGLEWAATPGGNEFWPYVSLAWRLTRDPRWQWLEGDERLIREYDLCGALGVPLGQLADLLRSLHVTIQQPLDQSLRGGTQTDGHLLARAEPELQALRSALVDAVGRHIQQLPPVDPQHPNLRHRRDRPVRFSGSWSVRLTGAGHHAHHVHPQGWFSSAFYVHLPDMAPPAGSIVFGQAPKELGIDLEPFFQVQPTPGHLVLFPSTTWHGTVPFEEGERITVAFDVAQPKA